MIQEPSPFDPMWYSHKFKGAGLRYEVGVGIGSANICWAFGPFPCGKYPDLKIYRLSMKTRLEEGELVVADNGYKDFICSFNTEEHINGGWGYVRARHEAVNKCLKHFLCQSQRFRHELGKHSVCFHAVANITYLLIETLHLLGPTMTLKENDSKYIKGRKFPKNFTEVAVWRSGQTLQGIAIYGNSATRGFTTMKRIRILLVSYPALFFQSKTM